MTMEKSVHGQKKLSVHTRMESSGHETTQRAEHKNSSVKAVSIYILYFTQLFYCSNWSTFFPSKQFVIC